MARGTSSSEKSESPNSIGAQAEGGSPLRREVSGILLLALSLFLGLSLGSLMLGSGTLMGPCGNFVALACYAVLGVGACLVAIAAGAEAIRRLRDRPRRLGRLQLAAWAGGALFASVLLHLATGTHRLRGFSTGGLVGEYGAEVMV